MDQKAYQQFVEQVTPKVNGWMSFFKAFVTGGAICVLGQVLRIGDVCTIWQTIIQL